MGGMLRKLDSELNTEGWSQMEEGTGDILIYLMLEGFKEKLGEHLWSMA